MKYSKNHAMLPILICCQLWVINGNSPGKSMSMNWQYAAPLHISSIFAKRESSDWLTQASMSCRERLSVVTDVEYTLTAILSVVEGGHLKEDVFPD